MNQLVLLTEPCNLSLTFLALFHIYLLGVQALIENVEHFTAQVQEHQREGSFGHVKVAF